MRTVFSSLMVTVLLCWLTLTSGGAGHADAIQLRRLQVASFDRDLAEVLRATRTATRPMVSSRKNLL